MPNAKMPSASGTSGRLTHDRLWMFGTCLAYLQRPAGEGVEDRRVATDGDQMKFSPPARKSAPRIAGELAPSHWSITCAYTDRKSVSKVTSAPPFSRVGLPGFGLSDAAVPYKPPLTRPPIAIMSAPAP